MTTKTSAYEKLASGRSLVEVCRGSGFTGKSLREDFTGQTDKNANGLPDQIDALNQMAVAYVKAARKLDVSDSEIIEQIKLVLTAQKSAPTAGVAESYDSLAPRVFGAKPKSGGRSTLATLLETVK